jgi:hypothetical protein
MVSSSSYALLRIAGWSFLPDFATRRLLPIIHSLSHTLFKHAPPDPRTPHYLKHYRLTFAGVVLGFLLYNLIEASRAMPPNFYEILGVGPDVDETGLKLAFRAFARKNHPDRVGSRGERVFIEVRDAFEALKDPVVRFAYDRFGPDVLTWTQCTTTREYLRHGLMQSSGYHIVTGAGLLFFSAIGKPNPVAFWRYLLFAALFASELGLLLSPTPSPSSAYSPSSSAYPLPHNSTIFTTLFPRRVAYQHVLFLHQLFMFMSIAISRVAPMLMPIVRESMGLEVHDESEMTQEGFGSRLVDRIGTLVRAADREVYLMLHTELHSVQPQEKSQTKFASPKPLSKPAEVVMDTLTHEMQNMIIENTLRKEAPLRSTWEAAIARGQARERGRAVTMVDMRSGGGGGVDAAGQEGKRGGFPSPRTPNGKSRQNLFGSHAVESPGRLPSPRPSPSPPPGLKRRGSSCVRARSISWDCGSPSPADGRGKMTGQINCIPP